MYTGFGTAAFNSRTLRYTWCLKKRADLGTPYASRCRQGADWLFKPALA